MKLPKPIRFKRHGVVLARVYAEGKGQVTNFVHENLGQTKFYYANWVGLQGEWQAAADQVIRWINGEETPPSAHV